MANANQYALRCDVSLNIVERQTFETGHLAADLLCGAKEAKLKSVMIMPIEVDLTKHGRKMMKLQSLCERIK